MYAHIVKHDRYSGTQMYLYVLTPYEKLSPHINYAGQVVTLEQAFKLAEKANLPLHLDGCEIIQGHFGDKRR